MLNRLLYHIDLLHQRTAKYRHIGCSTKSTDVPEVHIAHGNIESGAVPTAVLYRILYHTAIGTNSSHTSEDTIRGHYQIDQFIGSFCIVGQSGQATINNHINSIEQAENHRPRSRSTGSPSRCADTG